MAPTAQDYKVGSLFHAVAVVGSVVNVELLARAVAKLAPMFCSLHGPFSDYSPPPRPLVLIPRWGNYEFGRVPIRVHDDGISQHHIEIVALVYEMLAVGLHGAPYFLFYGWTEITKRERAHLAPLPVYMNLPGEADVSL